MIKSDCIANAAIATSPAFSAEQYIAYANFAHRCHIMRILNFMHRIHPRRHHVASRAGGIAILAASAFMACSSEDEESRLKRELNDAQTAMAFCDQAPANCDVEEMAKRNSALSAAETALSNFQKKH